jgi:hypothetical protein
MTVTSKHLAQPAFHYLLIRALAAAIEPALELADAYREFFDKLGPYPQASTTKREG